MNLNKKTNAVKQILAKVMIVTILIVGVIFLTACNGGGGRVHRIIEFKSNDDFLSFIKEYNSQNDGFVYTFTIFDFNVEDNITLYRYNLSTIWALNRFSDGYAKMYDKDHSKGFGFGCEIIYHIDKINTQIRCSYGTRDDYNYHQEDEKVIKFLNSINKDDVLAGNMYDFFTSDEQFSKAFADLRTFDVEILDYREYYNYLYTYQIQINGNDEIKVQIASKNELPQEKLDEICQLLMDNIVIINTEG